MAGKAQGEAVLRYRRARFVARFPTDRVYAPSHFWLRQGSASCWRVGLTLFAMRMLGEPVELEFEVARGETMEAGQVLGWLEGFKAVSDLYAPLGGRFLGGNPRLTEAIELLKSDPYEAGWLYEVEGQPGEDCVDAAGYAALLDDTIDRMSGEGA